MKVKVMKPLISSEKRGKPVNHFCVKVSVCFIKLPAAVAV